MKLRRFFSVLSTTVVILTAALAMLLVGMRIFGLQIFSVLSGSMEQEISVGGVVYVREVDSEDIAEGDILTFRAGGAVVTHRVIELVPNESEPGTFLFRTQGDANDVPDKELLHPDNVIGKVVFDLPLLGYLATGLQTGAGKLVALLFGVLLIMLVLLPDRLLASEEQEEEGDKEPPEGD